MSFSFKRPNSRPNKDAVIYAVGWGVVAAVILIIITAISQEVEFKQGAALSWISYTILILAMLACPILYKKKLHKDQTLNTRQSYLLGVCLGFVCACVFALLLWAYMDFVDPDFLERFKAYQTQVWQENPNLSEIEKIEKIQWVGNTQPSHIVMNVWQELVMIGALFPLIVAVFVRKER